MKSKIRYLTPIILAVLVLPLFGAGAAWAQGQGPIYAEVDRTALTTDETLNLTVTLSTRSLLNAPRPSLPNLDGWAVVGSSSSSQISIINGDIASQVVYVYRLQPYQAGELVIEPIQVSLGGQAYSTQPIAVHVTQGTGAGPAAAAAPTAPASAAVAKALPVSELSGQDFYVEGAVDHATPYVGQQVVYTFRLYRATNMPGQPQYESPAFTGFWSETQEGQYDYRVQAAGRIYQVTEMQTLLFPSVVGPVTIEPARLAIPGGFFSSGRTLQTRPVELDVKPLPAGAPAGFEGAVGQFSLAATVDTAEGQVNEPLTWRVTLGGQGNVMAVPDPAWPEMPAWRDFESEATITTQVVDSRMAGSRTYERLLVPTAQGEFTIPALEYVYFDPDAGQYQTARTEPIPVSIAPGDSAVAAAPVLPAGTQTDNTVARTSSDIRHLKPVPPELAQSDTPLTGSALYWAAWAVPVVGTAGFFAWQRRQRYWESNLSLARSSQARKKARKALALARKKVPVAYEAAGQILGAYLADKLDRPVPGMTHQVRAELLAERGVGADLVERVEVIMVSSESGRFAPGADDADHARSLLQEAGMLIDTLDRVL